MKVVVLSESQLRLLVALAVLLNALVAFYPFRLDPPRFRRNALIRSPEGAWRFREPSIARTAAPPTFLTPAMQESELRLGLTFRSSKTLQTGPARILTIAENTFAANLTVGQEHADLIVRVRRPGAMTWGEPAFRLPVVFQEPAWHTIELRVADDSLSLALDGVLRLQEILPAGFMQSWNPTYRLPLGDDVTGNRPWQGDIRRAWVTVAGMTQDLLSADELETPPQAWFLPDRLRRPLSMRNTEFVPGLLHVVSFIPIGFGIAAIYRTRQPLLSAIVIGSALGLALQLGKVFCAKRHPFALGLVEQVLGAVLGGLLALYL